MVDIGLDGVLVTPLKQILHPKGDVYHALKASDKGYSSFGEAYFSSVIQSEVKGWKRHSKMILNIIVPVGAIKFYLQDERATSPTCKARQTVTLSQENYCRLTVPPGIWMAFQGLEQQNLLLNVASIEHDPLESENMPLDAFTIF